MKSSTSLSESLWWSSLYSHRVPWSEILIFSLLTPSTGSLERTPRPPLGCGSSCWSSSGSPVRPRGGPGGSREWARDPQWDLLARGDLVHSGVRQGGLGECWVGEDGEGVDGRTLVKTSSIGKSHSVLVLHLAVDVRWVRRDQMPSKLFWSVRLQEEGLPVCPRPGRDPERC